MSEYQNQLTEKAVTLLVSFDSLGVQRKVRTRKVTAETAHDDAETVVQGAVATDAEVKVVRASKRILECKQLRAIRKLFSRTKRFMKEKALPGPFKRGFYLIPHELLAVVCERLEASKGELVSLVDEFIQAYPVEVEAAREALKSLFQAGDYPEEGELRDAFKIDWQIVSLDVPERVNHIAASLFEAERTKLETRFRVAADEIGIALRVALKAHVDHLVERLTESPDGKQKVLRGPSLAKFQQFLDDFAARNITSDEELNVLATQAKELLAGVEAKDLRESKDLREVVTKGFANVQVSLDDYLVNKPKRDITFGFDDEEEGYGNAVGA